MMPKGVADAKDAGDMRQRKLNRLKEQEAIKLGGENANCCNKSVENSSELL